MGCDIHIIAQRRIPGGWNIIPFDPDLEDRHSYETFTALAGVRRRRDDIPAIAEGRGLPDDFFESIANLRWYDEPGIDKTIDTPYDELPKPFLYWDDAHSHSWVSLLEVYAYDWRGRGIDGYKDGTFADTCHKSFDHLGDPSLIRLVFWFDN
jgi:hypothetical protein